MLVLDHLIHTSPFYELAALLILAGAAGFLALQLRQPLLVSFIAVGVLAGPDVTGIISYHDPMLETLAELGIALLLFMVGLKLDVSLIKKLGPAALTTGLLQVLLCSGLGFLLATTLGYDRTEALIIGLALAFSSTIIVVKLLSDKRAIDSLYGKMALGILILQDLVVILATIIISALGPAEAARLGWMAFVGIGARLAVVVGLTGLFIRFAAMPISRVLAKSPELMVIFAIGFAGIAAALSSYFGLSKELGGLLAGVALASTPLNNLLAARLMALRDFLLLFFFVNLGAQMRLDGLMPLVGTALLFSAFVMIIKPAVILGIMKILRYRTRTGFLTGLTLSQISEFSLILVVMAQSAGLIGADFVNLFTLIGVITLGLSTYAITANTAIYGWLEMRSGLFKGRAPGEFPEEERVLEQNYDVIVYGVGRYGLCLAGEFRRHGYTVLAVDFDPEAIKRARAEGFAVIYGDAADPEFPKHLPLHSTKVIILAFHHYMTGPLSIDLRYALARSLRESGYKGHIAATSHIRDHDQKEDLSRQGIDIVLEPFRDAALEGAQKIVAELGGVPLVSETTMANDEGEPG